MVNAVMMTFGVVVLTIFGFGLGVAYCLYKDRSDNRRRLFEHMASDKIRKRVAEESDDETARKFNNLCRHVFGTDYLFNARIINRTHYRAKDVLDPSPRWHEVVEIANLLADGNPIVVPEVQRQLLKNMKVPDIVGALHYIGFTVDTIVVSKNDTPNTKQGNEDHEQTD